MTAVLIFVETYSGSHFSLQILLYFCYDYFFKDPIRILHVSRTFYNRIRTG